MTSFRGDTDKKVNVTFKILEDILNKLLGLRVIDVVSI